MSGNSCCHDSWSCHLEKIETEKHADFEAAQCKGSADHWDNIVLADLAVADSCFVGKEVSRHSFLSGRGVVAVGPSIHLDLDYMVIQNGANHCEKTWESIEVMWSMIGGCQDEVGESGGLDRGLRSLSFHAKEMR